MSGMCTWCHVDPAVGSNVGSHRPLCADCLDECNNEPARAPSDSDALDRLEDMRNATALSRWNGDDR